LPLHRGDKSSWLEVWTHLGFSIVTEVVKKRTIYRLDAARRPLTITLDEVEKLGSFVEIERILEQSDEVEQAEKDILEVARMLGLCDIEKRSYLGLLLALTNPDEGTFHGDGGP
ncbi:MAG: class IV adenylate cyclase, partial [Planctomycetes bacterium]|nr:class IV adenylate cyclase [Planctomycetota bacterium]